MRIKLLLFVLVMFLFSCAGSYKLIKPDSLNYVSAEDVDGLTSSYRYDVLRETGNKKYANKEFKKGMKLIAVEIENNTGRTINFRNDVRIYSGERQVFSAGAQDGTSCFTTTCTIVFTMGIALAYYY